MEEKMKISEFFEYNNQQVLQHRRHTASAYGGKRRGCIGKEKPYHLLSPSLGTGSLSEGTDGNTH